MAPRTFTPAEANAALAEVRPLAERLVAATAELRAAQAAQQELAGHIAGNGGDIAPDDLAAAQEAVLAAGAAVGDAVGELDRLGLQVKDLDTALLDFPALRRGEPVLLCWRLGEDEVGHWHGLEAGFAGRRPIDFD